MHVHVHRLPLVSVFGSFCVILRFRILYSAPGNFHSCRASVRGTQWSGGSLCFVPALRAQRRVRTAHGLPATSWLRNPALPPRPVLLLRHFLTCFVGPAWCPLSILSTPTPLADEEMSVAAWCCPRGSSRHAGRGVSARCCPAADGVWLSPGEVWPGRVMVCCVLCPLVPCGGDAHVVIIHLDVT